VGDGTLLEGDGTLLEGGGPPSRASAYAMAGSWLVAGSSAGRLRVFATST
jgi:hypothetical protein